MRYFRFFLFPFSILYMMITSFRNLLFNLGIFKQKSYAVPTIGIGNLSTGGTGKSVAVQYLIQQFQDHYPISVLSRGYGRLSKGFQKAKPSSTVKEIGDEPLMIYRQFNTTRVAVCNSRREGMKKLLADAVFPSNGLFLWDDCFQHRWVKPEFMLLLTSYSRPYFKDFLLPVGNLRELSEGARRADIVLMTKCPPKMSSTEMNAIREKMQLKSKQKLYFSSIRYSDKIQNKERKISLSILEKISFTLVVGIAYPEELIQFLKGKYLNFDFIIFSDHHAFSKSDIEKIKAQSKGRMILTTEKDYVRLSEKFDSDLLFYIPIEMVLLNNEEQAFLQDIRSALNLA